MLNIPIEFAVIAANCGVCGKEPTVKVFRQGDLQCLKYDALLGAGEERWSLNADHRPGILHEIMWHLAHVFEIPTDKIHAAMQRIPEYRALEGNDWP